jgi:hypothetical protein
MLNPSSQSVTVSFHFTDAFGQTIGNGSFMLDANRQIAAFLDEPPFSVPGQRPAIDAATFSFSSTEPIATIALRGRVNERGDFLMTTLPVVDLSRVSSQPVVIPHFAQGDGWSADVALVNGSDSAITGAVRFFDPVGTILETQNYSIASQSSVVLRRNYSGAPVQVGSVHVLPDAGRQSPSGISIFSHRVGGITITETGVATCLPVSASGIYAENSADLRSAFAIANGGSQPVTVAFDILSNAGTSTGITGTLSIPGNGQRSLFLDEIPGGAGLPPNFRGIVRATAVGGGAFSMIALRSRTNERGDFLISSVMPPDDGSGLPTDLYIPHFVTGGGYTTEFILLDRGGGSATSTTLLFFSQSGQPMPLIVQ